MILDFIKSFFDINKTTNNSDDKANIQSSVDKKDIKVNKIKNFKKINNIAINKKNKTIQEENIQLTDEEKFINELSYFSIGIVKQFAKKDYETERKRTYGFIQTIQFKDIYVHKSDIKNKTINKDDIVLFKYGKNRKGDVAKEVILLIDCKFPHIAMEYYLNKYKNIYPKFFNSKQSYKLFKILLLTKYLNIINETLLITLLTYLNNDETIRIVDNYIGLQKTISKKLSIFISSKINNNNYNIIISLKHKNLFFSNSIIFEKITELPNYINTKYAKLLNLIDKYQQYDHIKVSFGLNEIYNKFTDSDYKLAKSWINTNKKYEYEYAKMLSARGAELASIEFYLLLNLQVKDVAISQLENNLYNTEWKLFDLLVNDKQIDVKNSRGVINEQLSYSEHCVPKFKETQNGSIISILGVISPYFKMEKNETKLKYNAFHDRNYIENKIAILGEVTINDINNYSSRFSGQSLTLNFDKKNFIPDWLLEYPIEFYKFRDSIKTEIKNTISKYPNAKEYTILNKNLIAIFLSLGYDLPDEWITKKIITNEQLKFYNRLKIQAKIYITKPFLYLAILKHFTERLQKQTELEYQPKDYFQLIYYDDTYKYPLGIYDPTLIIKKLISTLDELWVEKNQIKFKSYLSFKYNQKGILYAKESINTEWKTLIAYCGGFIEGKGSCGFKPLIRGKHNICHVCSKLICPECNFCMTNCNRIKNR